VIFCSKFNFQSDQTKGRCIHEPAEWPKSGPVWW